MVNFRINDIVGVVSNNGKIYAYKQIGTEAEICDEKLNINDELDSTPNSEKNKIIQAARKAYILKIKG